MEAAVEQTTTTTTAGGTDYDHGDIAKGKRTKRQRPQSPILFTFSSTNNNDDLTYSPASSSGFPADSTTTEDEDTAESLILLSKGQPLGLSTSPKKNKDDYDRMFKFNSKKYIQSPATGKGGVFVYECKTCCRTFPSFQALGGHRASHKKPKINEDMRKPPPYTVVTHNEEFPFRNHNSSFSLQFSNRVSMTENINKFSSKLHECSICGTEFNSGQALGGHMRRHRAAGGGTKGGNSYATTNNNTNATTLSLIPFSPVTTAEVYDRKSENNTLCLGLSLDLNLPAPREATPAAADDQRQERSFGFSPTGESGKKQEPDVRLSTAPTLVDCHF